MLLARLAESTFWLGRYLERAEDLARALLVCEQIRLDIPGRDAPRWQRLATFAGVSPEKLVGPGSLVADVVLNRFNPSSLLGALYCARENLRRTRSLLPSECWHTLNALYLRIDALGPDVPPADLGAALAQVVSSSQQLAGQIATGMLRDEAHIFLRIGDHIECADMVLRIGTTVAETLIPDHHDFRFEDVRWIGLLKSVGAYQAYRRRFHASADFGSVLDLLIFDHAFPRSFAHAVQQIGHELSGLPRNDGPLVALRACSPAPMARTRAGFEHFAGDALDKLAQLSSALQSTYFAQPPSEADDAILAAGRPHVSTDATARALA